MIHKFSQYQKNRLIMAGIFLIFAIVVSIFQYFQDNQNPFPPPKTEITENTNISDIQQKTREKVLKILDDAEVQKTLERIKNSDEYYNKDGAIFLNRERKLPIKKDREYYSEWTVKTPGEKTRGTKRIVVGK